MSAYEHQKTKIEPVDSRLGRNTSILAKLSGGAMRPTLHLLIVSVIFMYPTVVLVLASPMKKAALVARCVHNVNTRWQRYA